METINSSNTLEFSQLLAQQAASLREMLKKMEVLSSQERSSTRGETEDFKELAADQALATVDDALQRQLVQELAQVVAAQRRIENHSYGRCAECGEMIDLRRLQAFPSAACCTACQTIHEHVRHVADRVHGHSAR